MVDKLAIKIKISAVTVRYALLNLPTISFGFVKSWSNWIKFFVSIISDPTTIEIPNIEKINNINNKLKLPFFNSVLSSTYLE